LIVTPRNDGDEAAFCVFAPLRDALRALDPDTDSDPDSDPDSPLNPEP